VPFILRITAKVFRSHIMVDSTTKGYPQLVRRRGGTFRFSLSSYPGHQTRFARSDRACPAGVTSFGEAHDSRATRYINLLIAFPFLVTKYTLLAFFM
jgi:hypothetical protein